MIDLLTLFSFPIGLPTFRYKLRVENAPQGGRALGHCYWNLSIVYQTCTFGVENSHFPLMVVICK